MLARHLAEAAESDHERVRFQPIGDLDAIERLLLLGHQAIEQEDEERGQRHRDDDGGGERRVRGRVEQTRGRGRGIENESEFAALREQHRALDRLAAFRAQHARDHIDADPLQHHVGEARRQG